MRGPTERQNDDKAALYVNNQFSLSFALCKGGVSTGWTERTLDSSAFRGQAGEDRFPVDRWRQEQQPLPRQYRTLRTEQRSFSAAAVRTAGLEETTAGSATGGGVSRNSGKSSTPSLAISGQRRPFLPVAVQHSGGSAELYSALGWIALAGDERSVGIGAGASAAMVANRVILVGNAPSGVVLCGVAGRQQRQQRHLRQVVEWFGMGGGRRLGIGRGHHNNATQSRQA